MKNGFYPCVCRRFLVTFFANHPATLPETRSGHTRLIRTARCVAYTSWRLSLCFIEDEFKAPWKLSLVLVTIKVVQELMECVVVLWGHWKMLWIGIHSGRVFAEVEFSPKKINGSALEMKNNILVAELLCNTLGLQCCVSRRHTVFGTTLNTTHHHPICTHRDTTLRTGESGQIKPGISQRVSGHHAHGKHSLFVRFVSETACASLRTRSWSWKPQTHRNKCGRQVVHREGRDSEGTVQLWKLRIFEKKACGFQRSPGLAQSRHVCLCKGRGKMMASSQVSLGAWSGAIQPARVGRSPQNRAFSALLFLLWTPAWPWSEPTGAVY